MSNVGSTSFDVGQVGEGLLCLKEETIDAGQVCGYEQMDDRVNQISVTSYDQNLGVAF